MAEGFTSNQTGLSDELNDTSLNISNDDNYVDDSYEQEGCKLIDDTFLNSTPRDDTNENPILGDESHRPDDAIKEQQDEFIKCLLSTLSKQKRSLLETRYQLLQRGQGNNNYNV